MDCLLSCLHALSAQIFEMEGLQISCLLKPNWPQPLQQSSDKQASSWRRASCHKGQNRHFLITVSSTSQSWSKCPVISKSFKCCFVPCCVQVLMTPVAIPTHGFHCLRFIFFAFFGWVVFRFLMLFTGTIEAMVYMCCRIPTPFPT